MVVRCAVIDRLSEAGFQSVLVARFVFGGGILVTAYWQWHCSHSAATWTSVYMLLKSIGEVSHPLLSCWISSVERNQPAVLLNSCAQLVLWPFVVQITSWCIAIDSQLRQNFFSIRVVKLWNNLPGEVVMAPTVNCFKGRFDRQCRQQIHYGMEIQTSWKCPMRQPSRH